jgi:hypothetical protein
MMNVNTVPVPGRGTYSSSMLRHLVQNRVGGIRNLPQFEHFGATSCSFRAASQNGCVRSSASGSVRIGAGMFLNGFTTGSVLLITPS